MILFGKLLIPLVKLALPLLVIKTLAMFPYGTSILILNLLPVYWLMRKFIHTQPSANHTPTLSVGSKRIVLMVHHVIVAMAVALIHILACQDCSHSTLPKKPLLTAHRGCSMDAAENTLYSFELSAKIPSVVTLETDVRISKDGQLFLLHDNTLARTTAILTTCPHVNPHFNASSLYYNSGKCPLAELPIKTDPSLRIPTFDKFLDVAKKYNKNVIFDLDLPHTEHPYREKYLQETLNAITNSNIQLEKVIKTR